MKRKKEKSAAEAADSKAQSRRAAEKAKAEAAAEKAKAKAEARAKKATAKAKAAADKRKAKAQAAAEKTAKKKRAARSKQPKARKRKRRLIRVAVILFILLVTGRIGLAIALPSLLRMGAETIGLEASWDDMSLTLTTGDLELRHLTLTNPKNGREVAHLEYLSVDVDVSALFTFDLRVHRLVVDGLDIDLHIGANGKLLDITLPTTDSDAGTADAPATGSATSTPFVEAAATATPAEEVALDLALPFEISALRIQNVEVHVHDASVEPQLDTRLDLNVRVSNLGSPDREARLAVTLRCPQVVEILRIEGYGDSRGRHLETRLSISAHGIQPHAVSDYLRHVGLEPAAHQISIQAGIEASCAPVADDPVRATGHLRLHDLHVMTDGQEALALDLADVVIANLTTRRLEFEDVHINGLRGAVHRLPNEALRIVGFDLLLDETDDDATESSPATRPAPIVATTADPSSYVFAIAALSCEDLEFKLSDTAYPEPVDLAVLVETLAIRGFVIDAERPDAECHLSAQLSMPGICDKLALTGSASPFADRQTFGLQLELTGLRPEAIDPYLKASGLASEFANGTLRSRIDVVLREANGRSVLDLSVHDTELIDNGVLRFGLDKLDLRGFRRDAEHAVLIADTIDLRGVDLPIERDASGDLHFLGLVRAAPSETNRAAPRQKVPPLPFTRAIVRAIPRADSGLPKLQINRLTSGDHRIRFRDASVSPSVDLEIGELGLEVENLALGDARGEAVDAKGRFKIAIPGVLEDLSVGITARHEAGSSNIDASMKIAATGIHTAAIQPYLDAANIASRLDSASLGLTLRFTAEQHEDATILTAEIDDVACVDGTTTLFSLRGARIGRAVLSPEQVLIDDVLIDAPSIDITRDAEGALHLLGLTIPLHTTADPQDPAPAPTDRAVVPTDPAVVVKAPTTEPSAPDPVAAPAPFTLEHITLRDATINWKDAIPNPPVDTALSLSVDLVHLALADAETPATFKVELGLRDQLDSAVFEGRFSVHPDHPYAHTKFHATGIRKGPLRSYLPPGVELELNNAAIRAEFDAVLTPTQYGYSTVVELRDAAFTDGDREWLGVDNITISAPRLDAERIEFDKVTVTNARHHLRQMADGSRHAFGLRITSPPDAPTPEPLVAATSAPSTEEPEPEEVLPQTPRRLDLPALVIDGIDLDLHTTIEVEHEDSPTSLVHAELRIDNPTPLTIWDDALDEFPPWQLRLRGAADGITSRVTLDISASPFDPDPGLGVDFMIRGLSGQRLAEIAPDLAEHVDASGLENGTLEAHARVRLQLRRRHLLDFDLNRRFGLTAEVDRLAFRDREGSNVLAGIDHIDVQVRSIEVAAQKVHVQSIEIVRPHLHVEKSEAGIHVLGVVVKLPAAAATDSATGETDKPEQAADATAPVTPVAAPDTTVAVPEAVLQIDEVLITELDCRYIDRSVEPQMDIPLQELDVVIRNWSNRALYEPVPFAFDVFLGGGKTLLPDRLPDETFFGGLAKGALRTLTRSKERGASERPIFDELSVTGRISLMPEFTGSAKINLSSFELLALRGLLGEAGLEVGDGTLDAGVRLQFHGVDGTAVDAQFTFDHLSLSERANGPVRTWLKLSAPLDVIIFLLRNDAGEINLPIAFTAESAGAGNGQLLSAFSIALSNTIAAAVAAAPYRIVGSVTELIGLSGHAKEDLTQETVAVSFAPVNTLITPDDRTLLDPLIKKLSADAQLVVVLQHELGSTDVSRAEILANPSRDQCLQLSRGMRTRRNRLTQERADIAAKARANFAIGRRQEADRLTAQLRRIDAELGETEAGLDRVLEILRPNAERRRGKRTKHATLAIAQKRLDQLRDYLESQGIAAERIDVRRPHFRNVREKADSCVTLTPKRLNAR